MYCLLSLQFIKLYRFVLNCGQNNFQESFLILQWLLLNDRIALGGNIHGIRS